MRPSILADTQLLSIMSDCIYVPSSLSLCAVRVKSFLDAFVQRGRGLQLRVHYLSYSRKMHRISMGGNAGCSAIIEHVTRPAGISYTSMQHP